MIRALFALSLALCAACGGTIRVSTRVLHPPRLEIARDERVTVLHAGDAFSLLLASGLASELRTRGVRADERSAAAPADDLTGSVLVLTVVLSTSMRTEWTTRPENVCGAYGCYVRNVSQPIDMPYFVAAYDARLEDARTRTVLESTSGVVETVGTGDSQVRRRLVALVLARILDATEPHEEALRLSFESIGDDALDAALRGLRENDFGRARAALTERLAAAGTDDETRARLHYDLALVLAFDPASSARDGAYDDALANAEAAVRLDPTGRHIDALERVRTLVSEAALERERRTRPPPTPGPGVPEVPDAYRGTIPAP